MQLTNCSTKIVEKAASNTMKYIRFIKYGQRNWRVQYQHDTEVLRKEKNNFKAKTGNLKSIGGSK